MANNSYSLRAILIQIQDLLDENDRKRLHFFFSSNISRQIRNDLSIGGTFNLIDCLFDQEIITEHNFTQLIQAFETIQCHAAVKLLKDYHRSILFPHQQQYEEDKYARQNSQIIATIEKHPIHSQLKQTTTTTQTNGSFPLIKYLLIVSVLSIISLTFVICINIRKVDRLKNQIKTKDAIIFYEQIVIKNYTEINKQLTKKVKQKLKGTVVASLNKHSKPARISIDRNQTIYILDIDNHRVLTRTKRAYQWETIIDEYQLKYPTNIYLDEKHDTLWICDYGNRRIVRWLLQKKTNSSIQNMISNISCSDLMMDDNQTYLYVSDWLNHQIKRWKVGDDYQLFQPETIYYLNDFNEPRDIFIDRNRSIYISDWKSNHIVKLVKGTNRGVIIADRRNLRQPGFSVDQSGCLYFADYANNRVLRWSNDAKQAVVILDESQIHRPIDLSFDRDNNLYVLEHEKNRIQKFSFV